jgi:hypothetical protein
VGWRHAFIAWPKPRQNRSVGNSALAVSGDALSFARFFLLKILKPQSPTPLVM